MKEPFHFADVLEEQVRRAGYTPGQLANLSGLPKTTIVNWVKGRVKKPQQWQPLLKLATVLRLDETEVTHLLQAAGHPSLAELRTLSDDGADRELLSPWTEPSRPQARPTPFQAIPDLPYFVGRADVLQALETTLLPAGSAPICSIQGMAGVGKTALAARLAYRLRYRFPDGVLWARLDSSDPMAVLSTFAQAYDYDVSQYTDLDSRSRLVRDLLAHKHALMILDNARRSAHIEPLLPPTGTCAVVVTTRRHDLAALRGARRFQLRPFSPQKRDSLNLFAQIMGETQMEQEAQTLSQIADLLGHLPLALAIAASRLAYEPGWSAADFLVLLQREQRRLHELRYEDQSVRLSFNLSYRQLSPAQQQFFNALSVMAGETFDAEAAAAISQTPLAESQDTLRKAYSLSLLQSGKSGRYRLHPLLHDYARERLSDESVFRRMVDYFVSYVEAQQRDYDALEPERGHILAALQTAHDRQLPAELVRGANAFTRFLLSKGLYGAARRHLLQARQAAESLADSAGLASTLLNLGRVARHDGDYEEAETFLQEALRLAYQLERPQLISAALAESGTVAGCRGHYGRSEAYLQEGIQLARQFGHRETLVILLKEMGVTAASDGDGQSAEDYYQEGLALARQLGQQEEVITLLRGLGGLASRRGQADQAQSYYRQALSLARAIDHRQGIATLLNNLSHLALQRGDHDRAEGFIGEGLDVANRSGDRLVRSLLLHKLGLLAHRRGQHEQASSHLQQGLALARESGHSELTVVLLNDAGMVATSRGHYQTADVLLQEAMDQAHQLGHRRLISMVLNQRGRLCLQQQAWSEAADAFRMALDLARAVAVKEQTAEALYGLAQVAAAQGDDARARRHGQQSLALFRERDHYRAAEVAQWLGSLRPPQA